MDARHAAGFLRLLAAGHIIVGLALPWLAYTPVFEPYHAHLLGAFAATDAQSHQLAAFMVGILGPTVASWGVLFWYLVDDGYRRRSRRAWYAMLIAVIGWSVCDMAWSAVFGVWANILIDLSVLGLLLIPLLGSRKHFTRMEQTS